MVDKPRRSVRLFGGSLHNIGRQSEPKTPAQKAPDKKVAAKKSSLEGREVELVTQKRVSMELYSPRAKRASKKTEVIAREVFSRDWGQIKEYIKAYLAEVKEAKGTEFYNPIQSKKLGIKEIAVLVTCVEHIEDPKIRGKELDAIIKKLGGSKTYKRVKSASLNKKSKVVEILITQHKAIDGALYKKYKAKADQEYERQALLLEKHSAFDAMAEEYGILSEKMKGLIDAEVDFDKQAQRLKELDDRLTDVYQGLKLSSAAAQNRRSARLSAHQQALSRIAHLKAQHSALDKSAYIADSGLSGLKEEYASKKREANLISRRMHDDSKKIQSRRARLSALKTLKKELKARKAAIKGGFFSRKTLSKKDQESLAALKEQLFEVRAEIGVLDKEVRHIVKNFKALKKENKKVLDVAYKAWASIRQKEDSLISLEHSKLLVRKELEQAYFALRSDIQGELDDIRRLF